MLIAIGGIALMLGGGGLAYAVMGAEHEGIPTDEQEVGAGVDEAGEPGAELAATDTIAEADAAAARLDAMADDLERQAQGIEYALEGKEIPAELRGVEAKLTCGAGSQRMPLIACFAGNSGLGSYGKLAVKSAGQTRIYQQVDFHELEFSGAEKVVSLSVPFAVVAQAGSNPAYTLRVDLYDKGQLVASDQAGASGIASVGG
jgi:hypothetical protein